MGSHKHHEHLERIKEAIKTSTLSPEEKSTSLKHIEEWFAEDKANGIIFEELIKINEKLEPILKELGLL